MSKGREEREEGSGALNRERGLNGVRKEERREKSCAERGMRKENV